VSAAEWLLVALLFVGISAGLADILRRR